MGESNDFRKNLADSGDIHRLLTQEARGVNRYYSEMTMISSWTIDSLRARPVLRAPTEQRLGLCQRLL